MDTVRTDECTSTAGRRRSSSLGRSDEANSYADSLGSEQDEEPQM